MVKSTPTDRHYTETTEAQRETEEAISALFEKADPDKTTLNIRNHVMFCAKLVYQGLPKRYTAQDASQPWHLFWNLQACQILGLAFDTAIKQKAIASILRFQHPEGGFGGGKGQNAHLLPTYASVCALAIVGQPGENGGWDQIDRKKVYEWFMSLKQPDGSFLVSKDAEVDMRGIYCLLVVATMLDIVTPELVKGLRVFIASCQTYEGGFSASSQPYFSGSPPSLDNLLASPRPPLGEAHGGYTFCALASLVLLEPIDPHPTPDPTGRKWMGIDIRRLYRWASSLQGSEVDGGGFRGRTNKLVDGCYCWWVGGLFPLLEDIMGMSHKHKELVEEKHGPKEGLPDALEDWTDDDYGLYNRQALQGFVLVSSQVEAGGLRDKPGKSPDSYHTLYNLSGLSSSQHHVYRPNETKEKFESEWIASSRSVELGTGAKTRSGKEKEDALRKAVYVASTAWTEEEGASRYVGGRPNRVNATHPTFDLTISISRAFMKHFYEQDTPSPSQ